MCAPGACRCACCVEQYGMPDVCVRVCGRWVDEGTQDSCAWGLQVGLQSFVGAQWGGAKSYGRRAG